jgi:ribosomal-protein-alanine N-acetyltransferase
MDILDSFNTERLSAERLEQCHLEFIHRMHQDERVMAYLSGKRSREQTLEYMEQNLAHWDKYGYGIWILRDNTAGIFAGRGGLRNAVIDGGDEVEVAYGLMPEFWNRGLATEFVRAVMNIGLVKLRLSSLVCVTNPDNLASRRVMEKAGFEFERDVIYKDEPQLLFRHDNRVH